MTSTAFGTKSFRDFIVTDFMFSFAEEVLAVAVG